MMPINKKLIDDLYGKHSKFIESNDRHEPLESWILRYDRGMGFTPEVLNICNEIGVIPVEEDPRIELYGHLEYLVKKSLNEPLTKTP